MLAKIVERFEVQKCIGIRNVVDERMAASLDANV